MINYLHIILHSSNVWSFIYSFTFFTFYGYITNSQCDQLPDGVIAQFVEHCAGISEVMGSNYAQAWFFFLALISQLLSCVCNCDDQSCLNISYFYFFDIFILCHLVFWKILCVLMWFFYKNSGPPYTSELKQVL